MTTKPDTSEIPTPESDFHKLVDNFNGSKPVLISGSEIVTYKFACSLEKQLHLANLEKERLAADLKLLEDSIHFLGESSHRSGDCIKIIRKLSEELSQLKQANLEKEKLSEFVKNLEWSASVNTEMHHVKACPYCYGWKPDTGNHDFWNGRELRRGHKDDCELSKIVNKELSQLKQAKPLSEQSEKAMFALSGIVSALPSNRDWLDPDLESIAKQSIQNWNDQQTK